MGVSTRSISVVVRTPGSVSDADARTADMPGATGLRYRIGVGIDTVGLLGHSGPVPDELTSKQCTELGERLRTLQAV